MAKTETETTDTAQLAGAIVKLAEQMGSDKQTTNEMLAALRASQPERVITFGDTEYQAKLRALNKPFPRPVFQNQFEANPSGLSDATLQKVAELVPGTYLGGVVRIEPVQNNGIVFRYSTKSVEQRMKNDRIFGSFTELVEKCWAEAHTATS